MSCDGQRVDHVCVDRSELGGRWWLQGRTSSQLADTCVALLKDLASVSSRGHLWSLVVGHSTLESLCLPLDVKPDFVYVSIVTDGADIHPILS